MKIGRFGFASWDEVWTNMWFKLKCKVHISNRQATPSIETKVVKEGVDCVHLIAFAIVSAHVPRQKDRQKIPVPTPPRIDCKVDLSQSDCVVRRQTMPKKHAEEFEYLANNPNYVPDPDIEEFMEEEISRAPRDSELLAHRLRNNTSSSPRDAGGDLDAAWEDVNESGSETVAGDNPTPDQSLVEENARAVGVTYEDNEELEFIEKIEKRDRERFELEEGSKSTDDMI
jgi:hypothetical protein